MPIDPTLYPSDWEEISRDLRWNRAQGRCEGSPLYPDCRARNYMPHPVTGSTVILTVAHLDHDTTNNDATNLRVLCQRCHLAHDREQHARSAARTRRQRLIDAGQLQLPLTPKGADQ